MLDIAQPLTKDIFGGIAEPFEVAHLNAERREHLTHLIVQLARQRPAFFLLSANQLLAEPAQLALGLLGTPVSLCGAVLEARDAENTGAGDYDANAKGECEHAQEQDTRGLLAASEVAFLAAEALPGQGF